MASPQTGNGFVSIANETFDALGRTKIPAAARQVLDVIFRKTYGWNKLTDTISISQFSKATGICKRNVIRAIHQLEKMNMISVERWGSGENDTGGGENDTTPVTKISTYRFNKDYDTWGSGENDTGVVAKMTLGGSGKIDTEGSVNRGILLPIDNKRQLTKDITPLSPKGENTKNKLSADNPIKKKRTSELSAELQESFSLFWSAYPKHESKITAEKAWLKISPQNGLVETICSAIEKFKSSPNWKKDNGQYIPMPATWLNQRRWEDEIGIFKSNKQATLKRMIEECTE